ncbi:MAG: hypothetical protein K6G85_10770 [Eubacterium sp.]|nr:hypothetical protein [Eubacterium sp.]
MKKISGVVITITMVLALMLMPAEGMKTVSAAEEYQLVFEPGEGSGSMSSEVVAEGQFYEFPECSFEAPKNKTFGYWDMSGVDGRFNPGENVKIANNCVQEGRIRVTAHWKDAPQIHDGITFEPTNTLPDSSGSYYLTEDIELVDTWIVSENKTINLCLNGHGIKMKKSVNKRVIAVEQGSTLNIYDCDTVTEHKYTLGDECAEFNEDGDKTFVGGYITGGKCSDDDSEAYYGGGAILCNGECTLNGGTIIGNRSLCNHIYDPKYKGGAIYVSGPKAKFVIKKGNIIGNHSCTDGGGIFAEDGAVVEMYEGGNISDNCGGRYIYSGGGGVAVVGNATFNMYGGRISDNKAVTGSGVYIYDGATMNMSGGIIENNRTKDDHSILGKGGGVANGSVFNMSGGMIRNNVAESGGGVIVFNRQTFNMSGGMIVGNESTANRPDAGIELGTGAHFELSGNLEIYGNTNNGKAANVYLEGDSDTQKSTKILITGKLKNTLPIGITMESVTGTFTEGLSKNGDFSYFKSDADGYVPMFTAKGEAQIVEGAWNFVGIHWTGDAKKGYSKAIADYEYSKDQSVKHSMATKMTTKQVGRTMNYYAIVDKNWSIDGKEHHDSRTVTNLKKSNTLSIKGKTVKVQYKKLKKKAIKVKAKKYIKYKKKGNGKLRYQLVKVKKSKFKKYFKIHKKTGKLTIKKKLKKGTYKITVKVKAAGNTDYKASNWKKITVKVKVK